MNNKFKIMSLLASSFIMLTACQSSTTPMKDSGEAKIGLVTGSGGIYDKSFNQGTHEGILEWIKENKNATEVPPIETKNLSEYASNLTNMANNASIVFASGFTFQEPLTTVAPQIAKTKPEVKFVLIDAEVNEKNVVSYLFAEQEAGYLAGIAAANQTKTNKVGFIGGQAIPSVQKFGWGFIAGVQSVNPQIEIFYEYASDFNDVAKGKTLAATMYDQNVDIIFSAAGAVGTGVINEAKERAKDGSDIKQWVIGVDRDQYDEGLLNKDDENSQSIILTSAVKRVDQAAKTALTSIKDGKFEGGKTIILTAKEDAVGIPSENKNLSDDTSNKILSTLQQIKEDKIQIPVTQQQINQFVTDNAIKIIGKY